MKIMSMAVTLSAYCILALGLAPAYAQHGHEGHDHAKEAATPMCPVLDQPANLALSVPMDDGPVYFCCKGCVVKYKMNPAKYASKVADQRKALAGRAKVQVTCPVTKNPVDRKVSIDNNGEAVYFCCKGCVGKYQSDPAKYASALANSYSYQTTCPVMGGKINPKVSTTLTTGETIYYCCKGCDKPLRSNPAKYNAKLVAQGILVNWAEVKEAGSGHKDGDGHDGHDHDGHDGHDH